jgi:hypothetical protein
VNSNDAIKGKASDETKIMAAIRGIANELTRVPKPSTRREGV